MSSEIFLIRCAVKEAALPISRSDIDQMSLGGLSSFLSRPKGSTRLESIGDIGRGMVLGPLGSVAGNYVGDAASRVIHAGADLISRPLTPMQSQHLRQHAWKGGEIIGNIALPILLRRLKSKKQKPKKEEPKATPEKPTEKKE
jgi:hypothetical protein